MISTSLVALSKSIYATLFVQSCSIGRVESSVSPYSLVGQLPVFLIVELLISAVYTLSFFLGTTPKS